ncbi:MAG: hypothetical protein ACRBBP_02595 [Bdellovibrionales bacterium]
MSVSIMTKKVRKGLSKSLFLYVILISLVFTGCAGSPPLIEQAKAVEAQKYAKKNYAAKYAGAYYRKGTIYLKKAHEYYENRVYSKAKQAYYTARIYFEKSETKARVSQIKKGGAF